MTTVGPDPGPLARFLSDVFGQTVTVRQVDRIAPWFVARVRLTSPTEDVPRSVIVKWLRKHPADFRTDPRQLLTERASLEFLAELDLAVAPRLIAADDDGRFLVIEDLAPRTALFDLLRTGDDRGSLGLRTFARTMGELHTSTVGQGDSYYARRQALGPIDPLRDRRRVFGELWSWTLPHLDAFGVDFTMGAETEMTAICDVLLGAGPFAAFSNGDAGANNFLVDRGNGRIIDWEHGCYRHALIDAAALYVPGPMWMTVGDPSASGADDAYRTALADGIGAANDDEGFAQGLVGACIVMAIERLERLPKLDARSAGHESRAQMVSTLDAAARTAERFRAFPNLAAWARSTAAILRRRWPDSDRAFPDAYTTRE